MSENNCPFCGEPSIRHYVSGTTYRCGTHGPDINGEYATGHTCDIATYKRLLDARDAEIERLREELAACKANRIELFQNDWMPGYGAFEVGSATRGPAHIAINLGAFLCCIERGESDRADMPYGVAETIVHEVIHALEEWAGVEFDEQRVDALIVKYRDHIAAEAAKEE